MGLIFFGTKDTPIGIDEQFCYCQSCEGDSLADIMILSTYFHIYYLPLFPVSKEVNIICQKCGMKSYGLPFNSKVIKNYSEIKSKFKHPWFTYIFLGFILFLILIAIISEHFTSRS
jgi:hypothetical protein